MSEGSGIIENRSKRHNWHGRKVKFAGNFDKESSSSSRKYRRKSPAFIKFNWIDDDFYDESDESQDLEHGVPKAHHWHLHRKNNRDSFSRKTMKPEDPPSPGDEGAEDDENPFQDPKEFGENNDGPFGDDEKFDEQPSRQLWPFRRGSSTLNPKNSLSKLRIRRKSNE